MRRAGEKGFVDEVVIFCDGVEIARHVRSYARDDFVFEPCHYLALLEQKPGALDRAAPLQGWTLPETLAHLRRLLEARMGRRGKREFIQVLRLTEVFPEAVVFDAALWAPSVSTRSNNSSSQGPRTGPPVAIFPPIPIFRRRASRAAFVG